MPGEARTAPRLGSLTEEQRRASRVSAGRLIQLERQTVKDVSKDVSAAIDSAVAASQRQKDAAKAAILALLLMSSRAMAHNVTQTLARRRDEARTAARERLQRELAAAKAPLAGPVEASESGREDDAHASSAGDGLASAWRAIAILAVSKAFRNGESPAGAVEETRREMANRIGRTAATETAQAYNDEHAKALALTVEKHEELRSPFNGFRLARRWDAILDMRTCPECRAHDGELALPSGNFEGNDEPGFLHPLCRCMDVLVAVSAQMIDTLAA